MDYTVILLYALAFIPFFVGLSLGYIVGSGLKNEWINLYYSLKDKEIK